MDPIEPHSSEEEENFDANTGEIFETDQTKLPEGVIEPKLFSVSNWASLERFVTNLMHDTERADPGVNWCPEWWRHPEAITIYYALFRSFMANAESSDPGGKKEAEINAWLIHELFPQMSYLLSAEGPFAKCTTFNGHRYKDGRDEPKKAWSPYWELTPMSKGERKWTKRQQ